MGSKRILLSLVVSLLFVGLLTGCSDSKKPHPILDRTLTTMPYTRMTLLNGDYVPLQSYLTKPMAIMFWASWCSSSRSNIDDYAELAEEYRSFQFLAISLDEQQEEGRLRSYIEENKLQGLTHGFSGNKYDDEAVNAFAVEEIPYYFFIGKDGKILYSGDSRGDLEEAMLNIK